MYTYIYDVVVQFTRSARMNDCVIPFLVCRITPSGLRAPKKGHRLTYFCKLA